MNVLRDEILNTPHPLPTEATSPTRGEVKGVALFFIYDDGSTT